VQRKGLRGEDKVKSAIADTPKERARWLGKKGLADEERRRAEKETLIKRYPGTICQGRQGGRYAGFGARIT